MTTNKPDFYQLHIGQKVWVDGKERIIDYLCVIGEDNQREIGFIGTPGLNFDDLNISLSPPLDYRVLWGTLKDKINKKREELRGTGRFEEKCLLDAISMGMEEVEKEFVYNKRASLEMSIYRQKPIFVIGFFSRR